MTTRFTMEGIEVANGLYVFHATYDKMLHSEIPLENPEI